MLLSKYLILKSQIHAYNPSQAGGWGMRSAEAKHKTLSEK
jgi:hypothetical protein